MPLIQLEHVTKRYPGSERPVVHDLSLSIEAGQFCVLVGPSGCGKTTTLRMINRLVEPTEGVVRVDGQDVREVDPIQLRRRIGYVIQEVGLFPHMTIADNVATVPVELRWPRERIAQRVDELLRLVGLPPEEYRHRYPSALSGGQRQRVGVARALAADPPILLMDEPFGALDPINRARLQNEFLQLQRRLRKTIVFVTHDIDEAIKMGDRIAVMRRGRLVQYSTPDELLRAPADAFVEGLVGRNRALKRLHLIKVRDVVEGRRHPVVVSLRDRLDEVRQRMREAAVKVAFAVWDGGRAVAPITLEDIERASNGRATVEALLETGDSGPDGRAPLSNGKAAGYGDRPTGGDWPVLSVSVDLETTLHDALSEMVGMGADLAAIYDEQGRFCGVLSMEDVLGAMR
ncbi:MAG: betaine/proline/choline family ABC transporter ATP-binding protein [Firmicutes bacterium]|nr:betaine/proline/choline family ABC transporter ATP-binding protein [Bacillota bacterium]